MSTSVIVLLIVWVVAGVFIGVQFYRHRAEKPWRNVPGLIRFKRRKD